MKNADDAVDEHALRAKNKMTGPGNAFATAITCIDGRVQQPVTDWMKLHVNVHHVDLVTEPGPDKVISERTQPILDEVVRKVSFSIRHHASAVVALAGHYDCAANAATREKHVEQILESMRVLFSYNLETRLLGLYLNEESSVELVWDSQVQGQARTFHKG